MAALGAAFALPLQPPGCNQTAHYALVQSLADGTPRIDRYHAQTCDTAYIDGHYYAAKSPGLALFTLPWYLGLDAVGAVPASRDLDKGFPAAMLAVPRRALWQVGLWGAVLPALALVVLFRSVARRIEPGTGTGAAVALGLGTMVLPFATVFFSHVLAATLGFAAFAVLFLRRNPALAGLLAGLAVTTEYPLAVLGAALAVYAWRRAPAYLAGLAVGVSPLLAFNWWAFGSPFHVSYANAVLEPGKTGHDVLGANSSGFFGIGTPSLRVTAELLFSAKGLLVLSPILAAGAAGLVLLYRRGFRAEATLAAAVSLVYVVYNSGYYVPFGGYVPGPRFLISIIPLLALGLLLALRRWPGATIALAVVSTGAMVVATAAEPLLGNDDTRSWLRRWQHGDFAQTVVTLLGDGHSWLAIAPFLVAALVAAVLAAARLPKPTLDATAIAAVGAWAIVLLAAPDLLRTDRSVGQAWGLIALVALLAVLALLLARPTPSRLVAAAPLGLLALPHFASHTKQSLAACVAAVLLLAAVGSRRFSSRSPSRR